jgi:Ca2+-binding RTX toxin-like protein
MRGGTNGAIDVGAFELAQGVPYVPTTQFVLHSAATGFTLDPSSPDSGLIGTTINGLPVWSAYQTATHIVRPGGTWADYAPGLDVSYSFSVGATTIPAGYEAFSTVAAQDGARRAMQLYSDVSGITFHESTDVNVADINYIFGIGSTNGGGWASYPSGGGGNHVQVGHVSWETAMNAGSYSLNLLLHELGHGVGLAHPGDYNGDSAVYTDADHYNDSGQYTNMSYWSEAYTGASFSQLATLGLHDILATQIEYGVNWSTRATDTVYGFNATAGSNSYNFGYDSTMAFSIWDGGGTDTLDFTGFSGGTVMDLRQGSFSSTGLETYNVSIAYGAVVENATGGAGNDRMMGNSTANVLSGGCGNDMIFGGSETDAVATINPRDFTGILLNDDPLVRNQYLSAGTNSSLAGGGFTVEMLVDLIRIPADGATLASYAVAGQVREFVVEAREAYSEYVYTNGVGAWVDYPSTINVAIHGVVYRTSIPTEPLVDGNPHRLSVAWDSASGRLNTYVDGALRDTAVHQQGVTVNSGGTLVFGQEQGSVGGGFATNQVLQGTIGDIRIFNDVRTAAEIADNAFTRLTGTEQGLVNNWQVQAGTTTRVTDVAVANPLINLTDLMPAAFTASQSSIYSSGFSAATILDNNLTSFNHTLNGANEWLRLDFNQTLTINQVEIVNRSSNGTRLDGATVSVLDAQGNVIFTSAPITGAASGATITINLPTSLDAHAVRIDHHNQYLHIAEVNVYGTAPAGVTVPPALLDTDLTIVNGGTMHNTAPAIDLSLDNDTLRGGIGNDTLYGGAGNDTLYGHGGSVAADSRFAATYAVELNAGSTSDQYAVVASYSGISGANSTVRFTIEMLVNISRLPSEVDFFTYANAQTANAIGLGLYPNGNIYIVYRGAEHDTGIAAATLTSGGEHRLSLTWDGLTATSQYVIYIDGAEAGRGAHPRQNWQMDAGGTLIFGQEQDSVGGGFQTSQIFPGTLADIRVFNDVRTPAEIAANAFAPLADPVREQGLVNNWQVTASTTTTIADARGGTALTLVGAAPVVTIFGNWDNDTLDGGIGNDTLNGGLGADALTGGAGIDTATYADATAAVMASLAIPGSNSGEAAGDTYSSIENLTGSGFADTLTGDANANALDGGAGDDVLRGGGGNDSLSGGVGSDTADFSDAVSDLRITLDATGGGVVEVGVLGTDTLTAIENLTGGSGNDTLTGNGGRNVLNGSVGFDTVDNAASTTWDVGFAFATGSTTYLNNGTDVDSLALIEKIMFGVGVDTVYSDGTVAVDGGANSDYLIMFGAGPHTVHLDSAATSSFNLLYLGAGNDTADVRGSTYAYMFGLGGNDIMTLGSAGGWAFGGEDNDTITGLGGNDILIGETGIDIISGGGGNDVVYAGVDNDTVTGGDGNDVLWGEAGDDNMTGGNGDDWLLGQDGIDTLNFDLGTDIGWAGAGADKFVWASSTQGADILIDFSHAEGDTFNFGHVGFGVAAGLTLVDGTTFLSGAGVTATQAAATVYFDTTSTALWFDADGTGAGTAQAIAFLSNGGGDIQASDFVFF